MSVVRKCGEMSSTNEACIPAKSIIKQIGLSKAEVNQLLEDGYLDKEIGKDKYFVTCEIKITPKYV